MNAAEYAAGQLEQSLDLLKMCLSGLDDAQYNAPAAGTANCSAKTHVHALTAVDYFVNMLVGGGQSSWGEVATKTGLPANPQEIWKSDAQIPLAELNAFSDRVREAALANVRKLSDADFDREVEAPIFGKRSVAWLLQLASAHTAGHAGDIAGVKGTQGLKGLPF